MDWKNIQVVSAAPQGRGGKGGDLDCLLNWLYGWIPLCGFNFQDEMISGRVDAACILSDMHDRIYLGSGNLLSERDLYDPMEAGDVEAHELGNCFETIGQAELALSKIRRILNGR